MWFKWLMGRSQAPETTVEQDKAKPSGLGTIELNPFATHDADGHETERDTLFEVQSPVDDRTEAWVGLDSLDGDVADEANVAYSPALASSLKDFEPHGEREPSVVHAHSHRLPMIPSLRLQAISLKVKLNGDEAHDLGNTSVDNLERYLKLCHDDLDGWLTLGEHFLAVGALSDAEAAFRVALQLEPSRPLTSAALGHTIYTTGRFQEARPLLEVACKHMDTEIELHEALFECVKACEDTEAVETLQAKIEELRRNYR